MEERKGRVDVLVVISVRDPVTLVSVISRLEFPFSLRIEDATVWVDNVVSINLIVEEREFVELDEQCGFIVQTCLTKHPKTEKIKLKVDVVN